MNREVLKAEGVAPPAPAIPLGGPGSPYPGWLAASCRAYVRAVYVRVRAFVPQQLGWGCCVLETLVTALLVSGRPRETGDMRPTSRRKGENELEG